MPKPSIYSVADINYTGTNPRFLTSGEMGTRTTASLIPTTRPANAVEGTIYSDASDHHLYFYTGTTWLALDAAPGGIPGGSNTQLQFNDSGAFAGDADLTWDKTNNTLSISNGSVGPLALDRGSNTDYVGINFGFLGSPVMSLIRTSGGLGGYFPTNSACFYSQAATSTDLVVQQNTALYVNSNMVIGWQSLSRGGILDTGLYRTGAGVVEVNNGTAGQYRDLRARSVQYNAVTVANLPASPVIGQVAAVSDGAASLAWGATVTGGSTSKYLVWWNGSNWTVIGK